MSTNPSMKQDWHPDHNMPSSEYNGTTLTKMTDPMGNRYIPEAPIARYDGDGETKGSVKY